MGARYRGKLESEIHGSIVKKLLVKKIKSLDKINIIVLYRVL
tara:strand:- start:12204 stop:12329 length:126 start_codon:yes stop_codon:yes gene_type:complete